VSFSRQVYFAAILAGWTALFGWVVCEFVILPRTAGAAWEAIPSAGVVGASIGAGVGAAASLAGGGMSRLVLRVAGGFVGGLAGGVIGGLIGQGLYWIGLPQWLGWTVIGIGIGGTDALFGGDARRLRNGLIGGLFGGLVGGLLFRILSVAFQGGTGMTARAIGFVAIGIAIGTMVGLVQVLLRNAWLTVIDGEGAGRQLLLAGESAPLGSSPADALVIRGSGVEPAHASLVRTTAGYSIQDNSSGGTLVNDRPVVGCSPLANGDVIKIGSTYLRFNMSARVPQDDREMDTPEELPTSPKPVASPAPPSINPSPRPKPPTALPQRPARSSNPAPLPPPPPAKPPMPGLSKPSNTSSAVAPPPKPPAVPPPPAPFVKQTGAICSECGAAISGNAGLRVCPSCGAIS
jgi:hypothetical protein